MIVEGQTAYLLIIMHSPPRMSTLAQSFLPAANTTEAAKQEFGTAQDMDLTMLRHFRLGAITELQLSTMFKE
ncbi:MAG: hypothetical protein IJC61_06045, partial [Oscillospiraceae bacterium]|nr:hypothetical protein [Oscillospiraceae bacterium]